MKTDNDFMQFALDGALWAYDDCGRVGAVIVQNGRIISFAGSDIRDGTHAEYTALLSVGWVGTGTHKPDSTIYVTYQPCLKRSNPKKISCSQYLIDSGIERVVYGAVDPNFNQWEAEAYLRNNGIHVSQIPDVQLQEECKKLFNDSFLPGTLPR